MKSNGMIRETVAFLSASVTLAVACPAFANGLLLYEVSPKGVGQGGAMVADGSEAATIAYNSAGMTRLEGLQLQANLYTYISSNSAKHLDSGIETQANRGIFPIPALFVNYKPTEWMAVGLGTYSMYGLALTWPDGWVGQAAVQKASLRSYQVQPSVAFGPFEGFSIGGGADIIYGTVDLRQGIPFGDDTWGSSKITGQTVGVGFNVGVLYEPSSTVRLGVQYRSGVQMKLDPGDVDFTVPAAFDDQLVDQHVRTSLNLAPMLTVGARVSPSENFSFEGDFNWVWWSAYDKLDFQFDDPALHQVQAKNWKDAFEVRVGGEYGFGAWMARAGFILDESPIPDETLGPDLPDNWRLIPSVGGGYVINEMFQVDAAYHFVYIMPREVTAPENHFHASYKGHVHTIALGVTAKF